MGSCTLWGFKGKSNTVFTFPGSARKRALFKEIAVVWRSLRETATTKRVGKPLLLVMLVWWARGLVSHSADCWTVSYMYSVMKNWGVVLLRQNNLFKRKFWPRKAEVLAEDHLNKSFFTQLNFMVFFCSLVIDNMYLSFTTCIDTMYLTPQPSFATSNPSPLPSVALWTSPPSSFSGFALEGNKAGKFDLWILVQIFPLVQSERWVTPVFPLCQVLLVPFLLVKGKTDVPWYGLFSLMKPFF